MVSSLFSLSCLLMGQLWWKNIVWNILIIVLNLGPSQVTAIRTEQKVLDKRLVISPVLSSKEVASKIDLMKNAELGETSPLDLSYMNQKIRKKKVQFQIKARVENPANLKRKTNRNMKISHYFCASEQLWKFYRLVRKWSVLYFTPHWTASHTHCFVQWHVGAGSH